MAASLPKTEKAHPDVVLFPPGGSAGGCASGECAPHVVDRWKAAVETVRNVSPRHGKSLSHGRLVSLEPGRVTLFFPKDAAFHRSTVFGASRSFIEDELTKCLGQKTVVAEDNSGQSTGASIAEEEARETAERHTAIDARIHQHPAVKNVLRILGGQVEHISYLEPTPATPPAVPRAGPEEE